MQQQENKQSDFTIGKLTFSSNFQSGNLQNVISTNQNQFSLWIGQDHQASYRTWFYFSVEGVKAGSTLTFTIVNMNNQVKLFREGHLPVFKEDGSLWSRIKTPIAPNAITKGEAGFMVTFKHTFTSALKHFFAFTYPMTLKENDFLIKSLMEAKNEGFFCEYFPIAQSTQKRPVNLLTLTKSKKGEELLFDKIKILEKEITIFPKKKGIFISARVHPGETASSHIMNGILKSLFQENPLSFCLLQQCVFYIVPIINVDGVAEGNFRTDTQGKNLNRFYTNPNAETEPQIFGVKQFLIQMIKSKQRKIHFCLDLHAHVNKQGAFIYGNSSSSLSGQTKVCLFPKLLSFNSQIFDFESCNFSEKNMCSKDKGDELSKEGASRVAIYKDTGMVECWTLEVNYNSSRVINVKNQNPIFSKNGNVSGVVLAGKVQPESKQQIKYFNIPDFEALGFAILQSIADFYQLKESCRAFMKLKNMQNVKINVAVCSLRLMPFRFDAQCRKLLDCINSGANLKIVLNRISEIIKGQINQNFDINSARHIKSQNSSLNHQKNNSKPKVGSLQKIQKSQSGQKQISRKIQQKILYQKMPTIPRPIKSKLN